MTAKELESVSAISATKYDLVIAVKMENCWREIFVPRGGAHPDDLAAAEALVKSIYSRLGDR